MKKNQRKLLYNSYEGRLVLVPKQKTHTESKKSSNILSSITSRWLVAPWFISDLIIALRLVCATVCWCRLVISAKCSTKHNQLSHARLLSRCNLVMHRFSFFPRESGIECKLPGCVHRWSASAGCMKSWWWRRSNELLKWKRLTSVLNPACWVSEKKWARCSHTRAKWKRLASAWNVSRFQDSNLIFLLWTLLSKTSRIEGNALFPNSCHSNRKSWVKANWAWLWKHGLNLTTNLLKYSQK